MTARFRLGLVASVLALLAMVQGASAHAHMKSADPAPDSIVTAPPQEVRIAFSEAIEPGLSAIEIVGAKGPVATAGKAFVDPAAPATLVVKLSRPLPPGAYEARWRCVGKDSHVMRGNYRFDVRP